MKYCFLLVQLLISLIGSHKNSDVAINAPKFVFLALGLVMILIEVALTVGTLCQHMFLLEMLLSHGLIARGHTHRIS